MTAEEAEAERVRSKWHDDDLSDLSEERLQLDHTEEALEPKRCVCDNPVAWDGEDGRLCAKCGRAAS